MVQSFKEARATWLAAEAHITLLEVNGWTDRKGASATTAVCNAEWGIIKSLPPATDEETAQLGIFASYVAAKYKRHGGTSTGLEDAALAKLVFHLCDKAQ